jgi:hypothetical protein
MNKKLLEEISKINFLNSYEVGKTLNEQKDSDIGDILSEQDEPGFKTKSGSIGLNLGGKRNNLRDKQRGGLNANLSYTYSKELDEELSAPTNVIQKMNAELSSSYFYNKLTGEQRQKLGEAFYTALETFLDNPKVIMDKQASRSEKRDIRKLKKFFKKSQRWRFVIDNEIIPEEYKEVPISLIAEVEPSELVDLQSEIRTSLVNKFNTECVAEAVLSTGQSVYIGNNEDGTFNFAQTPKKPLSFIITSEKEDITPIKIKDANVKEKSSYQTIEIPKIVTNFAAGASDPKGELPKIMKSIYDTLYSTDFTYEKPNGDSESKTIKEMIECNRSGGCDVTYKIEVSQMYVTASASNTWSGKDVLLFTLDNAGEHVQGTSDFKEIMSAGGNNTKNANLAKLRGDNLATAVGTQLRKNTDLSITEDIYQKIKTDYEVTDTGGKLDNERTLPNPGQYATFSFSIKVTAIANVRESAESELTGEIANNCIYLQYVGKTGGDLMLDFNVFTTGPMYAQYIDHSGASDYMKLNKMKRRSKGNQRRYARSTGGVPDYKKRRQVYGR